MLSGIRSVLQREARDRASDRTSDTLCAMHPELALTSLAYAATGAKVACGSAADVDLQTTGP